MALEIRAGIGQEGLQHGLGGLLVIAVFRWSGGGTKRLLKEGDADALRTAYFLQGRRGPRPGFHHLGKQGQADADDLVLPGQASNRLLKKLFLVLADLGAILRQGTESTTECRQHPVGVAKRENVIDVALLEFSIREDLNKTAPRVMGVLDPLRVVIENYPEGKTESFETANNPEDPNGGMRSVPFSRVIYIEREDFMEEPPKKFFRLAPGREVRLRSAYFITCSGVTKDAAGNIVELRATYDPATRGGDSPDGRRPKATLHWVSAEHAIDCEVRLYDRLFRSENPEESGDFLADLNPDSLKVVTHAKLEPSVRGAAPLSRYQFERVGYFCVDQDSTSERLVFNRTATLKDTWAKIATAPLGVAKKPSD